MLHVERRGDGVDRQMSDRGFQSKRCLASSKNAVDWPSDRLGADDSLCTAGAGAARQWRDGHRCVGRARCHRATWRWVSRVAHAAVVRAMLADVPDVLVGTANSLQGLQRPAVAHPLAGCRDAEMFGVEPWPGCA